MKTPLRLLLIVTPVAFLLGLWMSLSKPGWSPRVAKRDLQTVRILCPAGVLTAPLLERLRKSEGLDVMVAAPDSPKDYFRRLYQDLSAFDLVCVPSHHLSAAILSEHFDPLPVAPEWRDRRLHTDFRSVPVDTDLDRFWPLGWRIYLPAIEASRAEAWATTHNRFALFLEPDFREVLHFYLQKKLLREDWLNPDHTDPLFSVLAKETPSYHFVSEEELTRKLTSESASDPSEPVQVLYVSHTLWHSLPSQAKERWMWGLPGVPGNLQVMGLLAPKGSSREVVETTLRVLSHPVTGTLLSETSKWASPLQGAGTQGPLHPSFLRNIPLTQFQWITGLDPSGLFWERIVSSAREPAPPESP